MGDPRKFEGVLHANVAAPLPLPASLLLLLLPHSDSRHTFHLVYEHQVSGYS